MVIEILDKKSYKRRREDLKMSRPIKIHNYMWTYGSACENIYWRIIIYRKVIEFYRHLDMANEIKKTCL